MLFLLHQIYIIILFWTWSGRNENNIMDVNAWEKTIRVRLFANVEWWVLRYAFRLEWNEGESCQLLLLLMLSIAWAS